MRTTPTPTLRPLELLANSATSVDAAPGTIVRSLQGTIWLTQEAMLRDVILVPGIRFVSASSGKIVLTPLDGAALARVYVPGCDGVAATAPGLSFDSGFFERQERVARRAQLREIGRRLDRLGETLSSAWHGALRRFRHTSAQH